MIKRLPWIGPLLVGVVARLGGGARPKSRDYWVERYRSGGNSGAGSYGAFARFKAEVLNQFVAERKVANVIEFGCGDGNQLTLADYPSYLGFDVSREAVARCRELFRADSTKSFRLIDEYRGERAQLVLSLDVIYHLLEDSVFARHMEMLFQAADRYVVIYATNVDRPPGTCAAHERHRIFTAWVEAHRKDWRLVEQLANPLAGPPDDPNGLFAEFFFYARA